MKGICVPLLLSTILVASCGQSDQTEPETPTSPASTAPASTGPSAAMISDGRAIAEANCASCHAIGTTGDSPRTDAPAFRVIMRDVNPEALSDDFREGIHVGATDMPDFDLGPRGTDAIVEYLKSIQVSVPAERQ